MGRNLNARLLLVKSVKSMLGFTDKWTTLIILIVKLAVTFILSVLTQWLCEE